MNLKNKNFPLLFLLLVLASIASCALTPPYVEPKSGSTATVKLMGINPDFLTIYEDGATCSEPRVWPCLALTSREISKETHTQKVCTNSPTSIRVAANREIAFRIGKLEYRGTVTAGCSMVVSFIPLAFKHYVLKLQMPGNQCLVTLHETSTETSSDYIPPVGVTLRKVLKDCRPGIAREFTYSLNPAYLLGPE